MGDAVPGDDDAVADDIGAHLRGHLGGVEVGIQGCDSRRTGERAGKRSGAGILIAHAESQVAVRVDEDLVVRAAEVRESEGQREALTVVVFQGERYAVCAGSLIEGLGYVNFYLLTTLLALPGIVLFWWMSRTGLVDAAMGTAGEVGEGDARAGPV